MKDNATFSKVQHGFMQWHSCVTKLLEVIESWTRILDAGGIVDAIHFDFAKGEVASHVLCPWDPSKYANMDTLISDRKITAGSGEWSKLKLVTGYEWNSAGSCISATSISAVHQ